MILRAVAAVLWSVAIFEIFGGAFVWRYHYDSHRQLQSHLADFINAYNYGRRLKTLKGLTPTSTSAKSGQQTRTDSHSIRSIKCRD